MELAFNLLRQSRLSMMDIAAQVGYQSQAAFSKKFKETYGEAPGRVRAQLSLIQRRSKCGRGLAPDSRVSVSSSATETLLSGASPLPY